MALSFGILPQETSDSHIPPHISLLASLFSLCGEKPIITLNIMDFTSLWCQLVNRPVQTRMQGGVGLVVKYLRLPDCAMKFRLNLQ